MNSFTASFFERHESDKYPEIPSSSLNSGVQQEASFPVKLMQILQLIDAKEPELAHIISWQTNGTTFRIHDKNLFEKLVKQRGFFNQKSYSSFRRQLNLWGFKKIGKRSKESCGVYGHPLFLRENPRLCSAISRCGSSSKLDKEVKALMEQENASKIINSSIHSSTVTPSAYESNFDVTAVTESTMSISTDNQASLKQEEYQFYGNLRRPRETYSFKPREEEEVCSSAYYNSTTCHNDENDACMLQELECFDSPMQSSHNSSFDLFNTQMAEEFDEDAFCEIEPLQLDEELTPLPSHCGKYLSDALGN
ncbi:hypothetical protein CTEN210_11848 [Chaetoceros tenuissimus]|uniref:HSF-type DNA-binding domain-containing protein n=1 Tax=Chaetoceros tenuissimus TaxID=426638 RepID=A0AAD3D0I0_9STRA|nr:hypothetical protein CTEN210_11848 [Chaetoceros tenuissimus]